MNTSAIVLVVDHDKSVLQGRSRTLAGMNFSVQAAITGDEALKILAHQAFDVILMESIIPGNEGLSLLRAIKALQPETEVVVIAGASSWKQAKEAIQLGAFDYLASSSPAEEISKAAARAAVQKKWALRRVTDQDPRQPTPEGEASWATHAKF